MGRLWSEMRVTLGGATLRPSTLWAVAVAMAWLPSAKFALVPAPLRMVPLFRASALAWMSMPSASRSERSTRYSNASVFVPPPLA